VSKLTREQGFLSYIYPSRRGGGGVEWGGDACVALVGGYVGGSPTKLASPIVGKLSRSHSTYANCEKDTTGDYYFPGLTPYGLVVLEAAKKMATTAITQRKASKNRTAIGIRTTPAALPPLRRCTAMIANTFRTIP
jgi:hypothetical protein